MNEYEPIGLYGSFLRNLIREMPEIKKRKNLEYTKPRKDVKKDYKRRTQEGRNEPCDCGSGVKFKKCCGKIIN